MAARIQSLRNGIAPIDEASRNDLVAGDIVTVTALDAATTYNWTIVFAPESPGGVPSAATFTGSSSAVSPGTFTVDNEGAYLIRLTVDAGLATESTQYVRLRALTTALGLRLVAAGERRDATGIIPVDVSIEGWANEQNYNLQALEAATSGEDGERYIAFSVAFAELSGVSPDTFSAVTQIPNNGYVTETTILVDTAWDGPGVFADLGDGTTFNRYMAVGDSNLGVVGRYTNPLWEKNTSGTVSPMTLTLTYGAGGTQGALTVIVKYVEVPSP